MFFCLIWRIIFLIASPWRTYSMHLQYLTPTNSESLQDYYIHEQELQVLINHYGEPKSVGDSTVEPTIDGIAIKQEWQHFKVLVSRNYPSVDVSTLWQLLNTKHIDKIHNLSKLDNIFVFCCQYLLNETLDMLMCTNLEGPSTENFDFTAALSAFRSQKECRIF